MAHYICRMTVVWLLALSMFASTSCIKGSKSSGNLGAIQESLKDIRTYSATLVYRIEGDKPSDEEPALRIAVESKISGELPNKLRMEGKWEKFVDFTLHYTVIFDGRNAWIESRIWTPSPGSAKTEPDLSHIHVDRIRLSALTNRTEPFDIFPYQLPGKGLMEGYDLVGTVRFLLRMYELRPVAERSVENVLCYVFEGTLREDVFAAYMRRKGYDPSDELVNLIRQWQDSARLYFSKHDGFIRKCEFLTAGGTTSVTATLHDLIINPPLPADTFVYEPPPGVTPVDATERVQAYRREQLEKLHDSESRKKQESDSKTTAR